MATATRTFAISVDAIAVEKPDGVDLGAGKDYHLWVGYSGGYVSRSVLTFSVDFGGMESITSAVLTLRTARSSDGTVGGYTRSGHGTYGSGTLYAERNTSAWSEGSYGGNEQWYLANAVNWGNKPSTTTTGRGSLATRATRPTSPSSDSITITSIVRAWAPVSAGGSGASNHGLTLRFASEASGNFTEYYAREAVEGVSAAVAAYITVTYTYSTGALPVSTPSNPVASTLATITNLATVYPTASDAVWSASGLHALPRFGWAYTAGTVSSSPTTQAGYRVRLYDAATAGNVIYDTDVITDPTIGTATTHTAVTAGSAYAYLPNGTAWQTVGGTAWTGLANATQYWSTVAVRDSAGQDGSESARTAFKVRWGQATYQYTAASLISSGGWSFTSAPVAANTQAAYLFRTATLANGSGTTSDWTTAIGALAVPTSGTAYLNVAVRLSTGTAATSPSLSSMTHSYASLALAPDKWTPVGASLALDRTTRRFGTRSAKATVSGTADAFLAPYLMDAWDDVPVQASTAYSFSAYVKTNGALTGTNTVGLRAYISPGAAVTTAAGMLTSATLLASSTALTNTNTDATSYPEGWARLSCQFTTDDTTTLVRPVIWYDWVSGAAGDVWWSDGAILEEGTVVRSWSPGFVSAASVVDGGGINIDKSAGGTLRLRGSAGGARDIVQVATHGLTFGGDSAAVEVSSGTASRLAVDGALDVTGAATISSGLTLGGTVTAAGNTIRADGHAVSVYDRGGSSDTTTITTAGTYYALTNAEVAFTPAYVGQRFLLTFTGYASLNTTTIQYLFVQCNVTTAANAIVETLGYTRADNWGTSGRGSTVAFTKYWTADAAAARKFKLYGTTQTTNGLTCTLGYTQMSVIPIA